MHNRHTFSYSLRTVKCKGHQRMQWEQILAVIIGLFLVWLLYRQISGNKEAFTKDNFTKSARTLGLLALGLIAFVAFCILMLRY